MDNKETLINHIEDKVPKLRFPEFTDPWEQRKLSEIATMHARIGWQNLRTSEFLDSGEYMLITGTDFEDGVVNYSTCHFVERERYEQDKHIQIKNGNILITKDGTLGKVAYVQGLSMPATLNAGVFNVEIKDKAMVDNRYLFQYLKAPFLMDYVDKKATGGTIKHLNQNILVDFPVVMPSKAEQEEIGRCFEQLDHLITLHQRKLILLNKYKKGVLKEIFKDIFIKYKKIKLKDISEIKSGEFVIKSKQNPNSKYPVYNGGTTYTGFYDDFNNNGNKIVISARGNAGYVNFVDQKFWAGNSCYVIDCKNSNIKFVYYQIKYYQNYLYKMQQTATIPSILKRDIENIDIFLPDLNIQNKIANLLSKLDIKISFEEKTLKLLKRYKTGLLKQMFI